MTPLKKLTLVLGLLIVAGLAAMLLQPRLVPGPTTAMQAKYKTTTLQIGATTVVAEVADTPASRELGLGNRTSLQDGRGMWFVFDADGLWAFWMKDTLIPLDMLWANAQGTIVHIAHDVQPSSYPQAFAPATPARYVLEVPAGYARRHGIAEGQKIVVQ